jgi:hypothetical protein
MLSGPESPGSGPHLQASGLPFHSSRRRGTYSTAPKMAGLKLEISLSFPPDWELLDMHTDNDNTCGKWAVVTAGTSPLFISNLYYIQQYFLKQYI